MKERKSNRRWTNFQRNKRRAKERKEKKKKGKHMFARKTNGHIHKATNEATLFDTAS